MRVNADGAGGAAGLQARPRGTVFSSAHAGRKGFSHWDSAGQALAIGTVTPRKEDGYLGAESQQDDLCHPAAGLTGSPASLWLQGARGSHPQARCPSHRLARREL